MAIAAGSAPTATDSGADTVAREAPAYNLTPEQLYGEFDANKVGAEAKYKDKVVTITGSIHDIGKDVMDTSYLVIGGNGLDGVQCMLPEGQEATIGKLSKGQVVTVKGKVNGQPLGNVLVNDCSLQ